MGTIKFDYKKPHYFVTDEKLKSQLSDLRGEEKKEQKVKQSGLTDLDLYALRNKYSDYLPKK